METGFILQTYKNIYKLKTVLGVTTGIFQFLLILAPPLDKNNTSA